MSARPTRDDGLGTYRRDASVSLALGILTLAAPWFGYGALLSLATGAVGVILGTDARRNLAPPDGRGRASAGIACSAAGLVFTGIMLVARVGSLEWLASRYQEKRPVLPSLFLMFPQII